MILAAAAAVLDRDQPRQRASFKARLPRAAPNGVSPLRRSRPISAHFGVSVRLVFSRRGRPAF
jgi:hypothetical protein